ncbi:MAG: hypothetical protein ACR2RL_21690 [Gammaproteobacteria bacterium]
MDLPIQPEASGEQTPQPMDPNAHHDNEGNALCLKWAERLRRARKRSRTRRDRITKNRKMLRGELDPDLREANEDGDKARANLLYATLRGLLPHLYARNPEVGVQPSAAVELASEPWVRPFSQTLEIGINRMLMEARLKSVGKRCTRSSLGSGPGWAKVSLQGGEVDNQIQARINDTHDNIARLRQLREDVERDEQSQQETETSLLELQHTLDGLQAQVEITAAVGFVAEYVPPENIETDPGIHALEDYAHGEWIAQRLFYTVERTKALFPGVNLDSATLYGSERNGDDDSDELARFSGLKNARASRDEDAYVCVWEIWAKSDQSVYTLIEGVREWAREPYQPQQLGERWYPFFGLFLLPSEDWWPMDMVELLEQLQYEYNDAREKLANARDASSPGIVISAEVDEKNVRRVRDAKTGDVTIIDTAGRPLREVMDSMPDPNINPALFDTQGILSDIQWVSGLQDAERGGVVRSKTATEAEILQQGLVSRTGEMQDTTEDWVNEIAKYVAEIMLQAFTPAQMQRLAGEASVWPQMRKDDIFELVDVEVRAGTSGKPNKQREQQQWMAFQQMLAQSLMTIRQLMAMGQDPSPEIELLRETARRFDERLDVEKFLPKPAQMQPGLGVQPGLEGQGAPPLAAQDGAGAQVVPIAGGVG